MPSDPRKAKTWKLNDSRTFTFSFASGKTEKDLPKELIYVKYDEILSEGL